MAFMYCHSDCVNCRAPIAYNPDCVPALSLDGVRRAICAVCFAEWNRIHRISKGLEPLRLHPDAFKALEVA